MALPLLCPGFSGYLAKSYSYQRGSERFGYDADMLNFRRLDKFLVRAEGDTLVPALRTSRFIKIVLRSLTTPGGGICIASAFLLANNYRAVLALDPSWALGKNQLVRGQYANNLGKDSF